MNVIRIFAILLAAASIGFSIWSVSYHGSSSLAYACGYVDGVWKTKYDKIPNETDFCDSYRTAARHADFNP